MTIPEEHLFEMRRRSGGLLAAMAVTMASGLFDGFPKPMFREKRRCCLPGCGIETEHNGGYCCAAHCHEHRQQLREVSKSAPLPVSES